MHGGRWRNPLSLRPTAGLSALDEWGWNLFVFIALDPLFGPICLQSFSSFDAEDAICFFAVLSSLECGCGGVMRSVYAVRVELSFLPRSFLSSYFSNLILLFRLFLLSVHIAIWCGYFYLNF